MTARGWRVAGHAVTQGEAVPLGVADPVIAARAVRRSLAQAGRRAVDVEALVVGAPDQLGAEALARFARRALGPHGDGVSAVGIADGDASADALASLAAEHLATTGLPGDGVGIAVGIAADGTAVALCIDRPVPGLGASEELDDEADEGSGQQ